MTKKLLLVTALAVSACGLNATQPTAPAAPAAQEAPKAEAPKAEEKKAEGSFLDTVHSYTLAPVENFVTGYPKSAMITFMALGVAAKYAYDYAMEAQNEEEDNLDVA